MDPTKVLIIDQHILVRRALTNILRKNDTFDVGWIADESPEVEAVIQDYNPDVVLLNIDDMQSDGFTILSMLRLKYPDLPIVVISPRNDHGAEAAINALRLGAVDFVTKPAHKNLILFAERHLEKRLPSLIKAAKNIHNRQHISEETLESFIHPQKTFEQIGEGEHTNKQAKIVVIGGCTGGAQALFTLVRALPKDLPVPVVVVQHLPRIYTKYLAAKLDSISDIRVREVEDRVLLDGGDVWIAPGGFQCEVTQSGYQTSLNTHRGLRENNMRPSIDILFRSAAQTYGSQTLGILLSGCGNDGLVGAEEIRKNEGQIIVQDPRSALAPELPFSAIKKGLSREFYSPGKLAEEIVRRVQPSKEKVAVGKSIVGNTFT